MGFTSFSRTSEITVKLGILANEVAKYPEVDWSEVCRKAIEAYLVKRRLGQLPLVDIARNILQFLEETGEATMETISRECSNRYCTTPEENEEALKIVLDKLIFRLKE